MKCFYTTTVILVMIIAAVTANTEVESGFVSLFNGQDLTGWDGNPKFWSAQNGVITGQTTPENPTKGNTFLIYRESKVDDFELRLQYKIIGGNSGIQYRSRDMGNWVVGGYQADFEAGTTFSGILYDERGRGILANRGQVTRITADPSNPQHHKVNVIGSVGHTDEIQSVIKDEEWNDYTVIAQGNQFIHMINGRVTSICIDDQKDKFKESGILALQLHAGPPMKLQFRNIRMKHLTPENIR